MRHRSIPVGLLTTSMSSALDTDDDDDDGDSGKRHQRHRILASRLATTMSLLLVSIMVVVSYRRQKRRLILPTVYRRPMDDVYKNSSCLYDGHCPVRSTCAVPSSSSSKNNINDDGSKPLGVCEPILIQGSATSVDDTCLQACTAELQLDEHFYQTSWPVVEWIETIHSAGRPVGCLLAYHREPEGDRWKQRESLLDPPLLDTWMAQRFRHVIRVDPLVENAIDNQRWISYCFRPCQSHADCATTNDNIHNSYNKVAPGFVCEQGACQRNPDYWATHMTKQGDNNNDPTLPSEQMVIITAATRGYVRGLRNLVASARYWAPTHAVVVYNLGGLTPVEQTEIRSWPNVIDLGWPHGVPARYPPHVQRGSIYAWKPIIINETLTKYKSIFWLDAGSSLAGPITPAEQIVQRTGMCVCMMYDVSIVSRIDWSIAACMHTCSAHKLTYILYIYIYICVVRTGMFLVKGQDMDMKLSAPESYLWFNTTKEKLPTGPHFSGNTQAYLYPSRYYDAVVAANAQCALTAECIAPTGSSLRNHRYDQTTLSIAAYHPKVRAPHYTEYLAYAIAQLSRDLLKPSTKFVWTSRQRNQFFTQYYAAKG
jgi:hypothetical protein